MGKLRTGDGRRGCDMGPLVTKEHRDKVASYIDIAEKDGATVVVDGRNPKVDGEPNGFWLGPTLVDKVPTNSKVYTEEIFGPVLSDAIGEITGGQEVVQFATGIPHLIKGFYSAHV